jgi:histone-lysine N-methyltransferase SETMAR
MLQPFITPPPYSPDVSPPDYFLFPKLKMKLKGLHFADVAEIREAVTDELKKVQKEEFSADFYKLYDRAKACIYANRAYLEFKKGTCLPHVSSARVFCTCLPHVSSI